MRKLAQAVALASVLAPQAGCFSVPDKIEHNVEVSLKLKCDVEGMTEETKCQLIEALGGLCIDEPDAGVE